MTKKKFEQHHPNIDIETGEILNFTPSTPPIMRPVKTQYNAESFQAYYEVNVLPSQTVPDQTMSLRILLERHAKGLPVTGNNAEPLYYGDEQMPDLNRMDISEIHDLKNAVKADIEQKKLALHQQQQAAKEAAEQKRLDDLVEKRAQEKRDKEKSDSKEK